MEFESVRFQRGFVDALPGDGGEALLPRQTPQVSFAFATPTPVKKPEMLIWSPEVGDLLQLPKPKKADGPEAQVFGGNMQLPGMRPFASRYGGHQFGYWAGQLGDGRAITLGQLPGRDGLNYEVQLKGAGMTPYSRHADGRAVLRSSLREFLCSEAMFYLGVPSTRALCCVTTGDEVIRDILYTGHPEPEPGAITTRVAPTFIRFGHFEILALTGEHELLKKFTDFTIQTYFVQHGTGTPDAYLGWFKEICARTAHLMVEWLRVGFVHGVMNTDNMSILGLTIDYGPYGWLDVYDPDWTPNTTDADQRRYRYGEQPSVALWNLTRLAEALSPLIQDEMALMEALEHFQTVFSEKYRRMIANKLGFQDLRESVDEALVVDLEGLLRTTEVDPTIFYRELAKLHEAYELSTRKPGYDESGFLFESLKPAFYDPTVHTEIQKRFADWTSLYLRRSRAEKSSAIERRQLMDKTNPYFILRNYLVQEILDELKAGSRKKLDAVFAALKNPYAETKATKPFYARRPEWARQRPGCSDLSCSS